MSQSFHSALVPPLVRNLLNLSHLLKRADAHAESCGYPMAVLLSSRLHPDMFDLTRQVQISTDISRRGVARLSGRDAPSMEDNETELSELLDRINSSIAFIESMPPPHSPSFATTACRSENSITSWAKRLLEELRGVLV